MLNYNFDEKANDAINFAFASARDLGHAYVGTEHLVVGLSMLSGVKLAEVLEEYGVTTNRLMEEIIKRIGRGKGQRGIEDYTRHAKTVLDRSFSYALKTNNAEIIPEHIFLSIMNDTACMGYKILKNAGLDFSKILLEPPVKSGKIIKQDQPKALTVKTLDYLEEYDDEGSMPIGFDLTERAKDMPFDEVIGREDTIDRIAQVMTRKTKNNVCLIGEPGVGKTAIVRGLANRLASGSCPENLKNKKIIEVDIGAIVSGTSFRGQFEERMQGMIKSLIAEPDQIVFFDEFHNLIGVGATGDKSLDAIGMLKPYLTTGQIQMIGATTYADFHKYIEPDQALVRRMTLIDVKEPTEHETLDILRHVKFEYEKHHGVIIAEEAIQAAVQLSQRYLTNRKFPDKSIDLIDEASSRKRFENIKNMEIVDELKYRLNQLKLEKEACILEMDLTKASKIQEEEKKLLSHIEDNIEIKTLMTTQKLIVNRHDVEQVVSDWVGVPVQRLTFDEKEKLRSLENILNQDVIGQKIAVDTVARALKRSRMGIQDPKKPTGVYLFVGPTGVGKTELAKSIANVFYGNDNQLIRLDMSEYMEKHSVSKLIGSPPGYEGNKEGGYLTNQVMNQPYSVVLFDEVEKAHPDILDLLLQIMDEGTLKDSRGVEVNFKNTLIVLTSNLGSDIKANRKMGFIVTEGQDAVEERIRDACKAYFKPEFINRMDEVVVFKELDLESSTRIVQDYIAEFSRQMQENKLEVLVEEGVAKYIAEKYYSVEYGARPLKRAVDREIKDRVADYLLQNDRVPEKIVLVLESTDGRIYVKSEE